ncbi:hypothetical protein ACM66B_004225 [Microbotryomycetes sp. NB124-2]
MLACRNRTIHTWSRCTRPLSTRLLCTLSGSGAERQSLSSSIETLQSITARRSLSTPSSTPVQAGQTDAQELLASYSQQPSRTVKLTDLTRYGIPPLSEHKLLDSAENTRHNLLVGLAKRVTQHLSLPFLPATNPSLQQIHNLYSTAFFNLVSLPPIKTLKDNDQLCQVVRQMVEAHRDNIPILAKGFQETKKYLPEDTITQFLDRAIRLRISLRLMAEQHLSLSAASLPALQAGTTIESAPSESVDLRVEPSARAPAVVSGAPTSDSKGATLQGGTGRRRVGILDLDLKPRDIIGSCAEFVTMLCESTYGVAPAYRIEGSGADQPVGAVASHLEYILTELLKNAFRATVEFNAPKREPVDEGVFRFEDLPHAHLDKMDLPEVVVTVGVVRGVLTIRIRDRGGGVPPENVDNIFSYSFTSVPNLPDPDSDPDSPGASAPDLYGGTAAAGYYGGVGGGPGGGESALQTSIGTLAGLGFGLPLSRIYSGYFGGSLDLVTMHGWGTDVYVVVPIVVSE